MSLTFAALREPGGKALGKALRGEAEAGLDGTVGHGERFVKIGGVGEISHAELVEPLERTRAAFAANQNIHMELLRVHKSESTTAGVLRRSQCIF